VLQPGKQILGIDEATADYESALAWDTPLFETNLVSSKTRLDSGETARYLLLGSYPPGRPFFQAQNCPFICFIRG
jgi:hypothetical protein